MTKDDIFDTGSDLGRRDMDFLDSILDDPTQDVLRSVGVRSGQRCLDLGAGGGSITGWLAEQTGPTGSVVAVDTDTDRLVEGRGVEVYRHDINDGLPAEGPYNVIHARLLLQQLPRRVQIVHSLVAALAPGGWLVLGELGSRPLRVHSAPEAGDAELFARMQHLSIRVVSPSLGLDFDWAYEVDGCMAGAGLVNIHGRSHSETTIGGGDGCQLHHNTNVQAEPLLLEAGASMDELKRYRALMHDPRFRAWFYEYVCTRGQKPG